MKIDISQRIKSSLSFMLPCKLWSLSVNFLLTKLHFLFKMSGKVIVKPIDQSFENGVEVVEEEEELEVP